MRRIDRIRLLDLVGRALQARMSYSDINGYLKSFGIDVNAKKTSGTNSKWVYSKEVLADESDELLFRIADELEIDHGLGGPVVPTLGESTFWKTSYFRLFLSHVSQIKDKAALLQKALLDFGIYGFVAHEDIEPTKEWEMEIEKALFSMDALAAIITPEFKNSRWTDQEVGVALGRGVLVIPVRRGADPHGFIGKIQGLPAGGRTVVEVAGGIFDVLSSNAKTRVRLTQSLVDQALVAPNAMEALRALRVIERIEVPVLPQFERLRDGIVSEPRLKDSADLVEALNSLLTKHGLAVLSTASSAQTEIDDDIPF